MSDKEKITENKVTKNEKTVEIQSEPPKVHNIIY